MNDDTKATKVRLAGAINARPDKSRVVRTNVRAGAAGHFLGRCGWGLGG